MKKEIPHEVLSIISTLEKHGFEAYVVGGCVRDLLLSRVPEDWDVATNAKPEQIQKIFPNSFYENKFFTVSVRTESTDPRLQEIEITSYRSDIRYGDRRHPEEVQYATTIEEDLSRRDFTMNALALKPTGKGHDLIDPFGGRQDIAAKLIRAVGDAPARFQEDALRMMRGVRFSATLGFTIEPATKEAIAKNAELLKEISEERMRDELVKLIMSDLAMEGIETLRKLGLLRYMMPELEEGYGVSQNKHHIYTVWEHNLFALRYATEQKWNFHVRLASLLHDVAKPRVKKGEGKDSTFYNHETVGARMVESMLARLKFPKKDVEKIAKLVRYHLFYYNAGEVTDSSVRRLVRNVGPEYVEELLQVRMADRIGSGVPKAEPYKLRHLRYLMEKISQDPISAKMIKITGTDIMRIGNMQPGPQIGYVLDILLGEVLEDPAKNDTAFLEARAKELLLLGEGKLKALSVKAKKQREIIETKRDEMTKQKYWVT